VNPFPAERVRVIFVHPGQEQAGMEEPSACSPHAVQCGKIISGFGGVDGGFD